MAGRPVTQSERDYCLSLLPPTDKTQWVKWIKKTKHDKIDERLLVIGDYRIMSVKAGGMGKKVKRQSHMYQIKRIQQNEPERVYIDFGDFFLDIESPNAQEIVQVLRQCYEKITVGWPQTLKLLELNSVEEGVCNGYIDTYNAFCDLFELPSSYDVIQHVESIWSTGIEGKGPLVDLKPVMAALRCNTYFTDFVVRKVNRREVVSELANCMLSNTTLTRIVLNAVDAKPEDFELLGRAIESNSGNAEQQIKGNAVVDYYITNNNLGKKGADALGAALKKVCHGIRTLDLSNCNLNAKAVESLIVNLGVNQRICEEIETFSLNGNACGDEGSTALNNWLGSMRFLTSTRLRSLGLSNTAINMDRVAGSLRAGCSSLVKLDLSNNKLNLDAVKFLCITVCNTTTITDINVADNKMSAESFAELANALWSNANLNKTKIDGSRNALGTRGAKLIAQKLGQARNVDTLILADCQLKVEGLEIICKVLQQNSTLRNLCLDRNDKKEDKKCEKIDAMLAGLVQSVPSLRILRVAGNSKNYFNELPRLFTAVGASTSLHTLDISGNKIGDKGLAFLVDRLKDNQSVMALYCDDNNISLSGWQGMKRVFVHNKVLCRVDTFTLDGARAIKAGDPRTKEKIQTALAEIQAAAKQNYDGRRGSLPEDFDEYNASAIVEDSGASGDGPSAAPADYGASAPAAGDEQGGDDGYGAAPPPPPPPPTYDEGY